MDHSVSLGAVNLVLMVLYYTIHGKAHRIPQDLPVALLAPYRLSMTVILFPLRQRARGEVKHSLTSPRNLQSMKHHNPSLQAMVTGVLYATTLESSLPATDGNDI